MGSLPCTPVEAVPELVRSAREAVAWRRRPLEERIGVVRGLGNAIPARGAELVAMLGAELGKPAGEAWTSEIVTMGELFDHWLAVIEDELEAIPLELNPLNYPGKQIGWSPRRSASSASSCRGTTRCTCRCARSSRRCSPATPSCSSRASMLRVAGRSSRRSSRAALPANLVVTVQGGPAHGAAVIDAGVDKVIFTGSGAGGRAVAARAAQHLIPCALELGSKDAALVLHDAKMPRAVEGIVWGAFHNAGQDCASVERVLVDQRIAERFVADVVKAAQALRVGRMSGRW